MIPKSRRRHVTRFRLVLAFAAWIAAAPYVADFLVAPRERLKADAIVVLSGSQVYDERIRHAIAAYNAAPVIAVILTNDGVIGGWSSRRQANLPSQLHGRDQLVDAGIDPDKIVLLSSKVGSTYDEAVVLRHYAEHSHIRSILLITSPYHSRRALWIFRRVLGEDVRVAIDSRPPGNHTPDRKWWWLTARGWHYVGLEYLKFAYYLVRHY